MLVWLNDLTDETRVLSIPIVITLPDHKSGREGASKLQITVEVQGNKVILRGTVRSYAEKQAAEDTAWSAPGVTEVDNRIVGVPSA